MITTTTKKLVCCQILNIKGAERGQAAQSSCELHTLLYTTAVQQQWWYLRMYMPNNTLYTHYFMSCIINIYKDLYHSQAVSTSSSSFVETDLGDRCRDRPRRGRRAATKVREEYVREDRDRQPRRERERNSALLTLTPHLCNNIMSVPRFSRRCTY